MRAGDSLPSILVVGAGVFGLTAALELRRRGYPVRVIDPGPIPHPHAASTDISKVVRIEYGADEFYSRQMASAIDRWKAWNADWGEAVYVETGVLMMSRGRMEPGSFEYESFACLNRLGYVPERISSEILRARYSEWNADLYTDGFFHAVGGFARSSRVIGHLDREARALGVEMMEGAGVERLIEQDDGGVRGVILREGRRLDAEETVLAAGAWTPRWLPEMEGEFRTVAQPIFYLQPPEPEAFRPEVFPVFTADIKRTGWYGLPANEEGTVKLANHGPGRLLDPEGERGVVPEDRARLKRFIQESFPGLAGATLSGEKSCLYCDTPDGDFLIARHPERTGLTLATGGSGHGFKFAPLLGGWTADALTGAPNAALERFRWRKVSTESRRSEAARFDG